MRFQASTAIRAATIPTTKAPPVAITMWISEPRRLKTPVTAAATAAAYSTSESASFTKLSPSMIAIKCRGIRKRSSTGAEASSSVGATIAPSTKATGHDMPGTTACNATATMTVVASTSPIASIPIWPGFASITSVGAVTASQ
jgi:hypothetical protein